MLPSLRLTAALALLLAAGIAPVALFACGGPAGSAGPADGAPGDGTTANEAGVDAPRGDAPSADDAPVDDDGASEGSSGDAGAEGGEGGQEASSNEAGAVDASDAGDGAVLLGRCEAGPVGDADVPGYVRVVRRPGACATAQIASYVRACDGPDGGACVSWYADPLNATCWACIQPLTGGQPDNTGATMNDLAGHAWPNYPGCLDLVDHDAGCAAPFEQLEQCSYFACGSAACYAEVYADAGAFSACLTGTYAGACQGYYGATAPCAPDFAEGGAWPTVCSTIQGVVTTVCGP